MNFLSTFNARDEPKSEFWARLLVLGIVVTMTRAWALTNLFEVLLVCITLYDPSLRKKVLSSFNDVRVFAVFLFWLWIAFSMSWSDAPIMERLGEFWSWRKLILVPICFSLFERDADKRLLMVVIVAVCSMYMVATWLGYFNLVELYRVPKHYLENHATQGVLFGACSLFCVLLALQNPNWKSTCLFVLLVAGFIANILLISTGRSGYLFLVVISGFSAFFWAKGQFKARVLSLLAGFGAVCIILATLFINETTRREINTAFTDIETAYTSEQLTSLGIRIVMWSNSLELIENKPLLGSGAGGYKYDYEALVAGQVGWRSKVIDDPHQQYLHIAAEHGLLGLFLFILAFSSWLFSKIPSTQIFYVAGIAVLLGTAANGFANGHFSAFVEGRFFWISVAAFLAGTQSYFPSLKIYSKSEK
tara:strand:- start:3899 stop:5155 length:1257 start_codon:yes stop_codon:yes gene_type:complete